MNTFWQLYDKLVVMVRRKEAAFYETFSGNRDVSVVMLSSVLFLLGCDPHAAASCLLSFASDLRNGTATRILRTVALY
jgi:hypothetical protein